MSRTLTLFAVILTMFTFICVVETRGAAQQGSDEPLRIVDKLSGADREQTLIEKAKAESGELTLYSFMKTSDSDFILNEFRKQYPFVKSTRHWRGRGTDIWRKISMEARAKKVQADVALGGTLELWDARREGLQIRYASPHRDAYPAMFNDQHGYWLGIAVTAVVMAYNENRVKTAGPPMHFKDLLHERWKGKFSMDTEPDELIAAMLKEWGREATEKYLQRLMMLEPNLRRGKSAQVELLCAGEFAVSLDVYAHSVAEYANAKDCPAKIIYPEFMPVKTDALSLLKGSRNPFTAALFFDWIASKEGAEVYIKTGRISPREDVDPPYNEIKQILKRTKVVDILPGAIDAKFSAQVHDVMQKFIHRRR